MITRWYDIGKTITVTHHHREVYGRIVGVESAENRRGFPAAGVVVVVQPDEGEPFEVYLPQSAAAGRVCDVER
jgi:hypothetical protein